MLVLLAIRFIYYQITGDMKLRKYIEKLLGKNNPDQIHPSGCERFKDWIREKNVQEKFAKDITEGTTVYFSDEFAACYDLRIKGFERPDTIVVQMNLHLGQSEEINEDFLELSVRTWSKLGWEVWYLDNQLKWIIVANEKGRTKYSHKEVVQSDRINFEFMLSQIKTK